MDRNIVMASQKNTSTFDKHRDQTDNNYYRDAFRNITRIVNIQVAIIFVLAGGFSFYVIKKENEDRYIAETAEGRQMQMAGLQSPNMGRMALSSWVSQAVTQIMTFGFNDIDERFSLSQQNFTEPGWKSFSEAMKKSILLKSVMESQQIIAAVLQGPPVLLQEGLIEDTYSWVFEVKILMTIRAGGVKRTDRKTVTVTVEKVSTKDSVNGVGIGKWVMY